MLDLLGPHALADTAAVRRWSGSARIVKQAFGTSVLKAAKDANPNLLTVCRPIWQLTTDSAAAAAGDIISFYQAHGFTPDYTELWNEGDELGQNLGHGLERRVALTAQAVSILSGAGIKVAGGSHSVGQPQQADIQYWVDNGWAGMHVLALHEYWFDPAYGGCGSGFDGFCALRYRMIRQWASGNTPPIIITECGRHASGPEDWGWTKAGISAQTYVNELEAYSRELAQDSYIIGANVFTNASPGTEWDNRGFNTDPLVDLIVGAAPGPGPGPGPGPEPPPGGGGVILPVSGGLVGLMAGVLVGGALAVIAALEIAGVRGKITIGEEERQFLGPEEVPVLELEPGQPIPPGFTRVEPV